MQQILGRAGDLTGRVGIDAVAAQAVVEAALTGAIKAGEAINRIGGGRFGTRFHTSRRGQAQIAFADHGGQGSAQLGLAEGLGVTEQPGETRMSRQRRHALAEVAGGRPRCRARPEQGEEFFGVLKPVCFGRFEPRESTRIGGAPAFEGEQRRGEIDPAQFGVGGERSARVLAWRPQPDAAARCGAARPAGTLIGTVATDWLDPQRVEAGVGIEAIDAGGSRVDHGAHAGHGHAGFGHVGGEDDLRSRPGAQGAVLLFGWQTAMQGEHVVGRLKIGQTRGGAADLASAGQKDQHVTAVTGRDRVAHGGGGGVLDALAGGGRGMADLDREGSPRRVDHRHAKKSRHWAGIDGRGHDHDFQLRAHRALQLAQTGEGEVGVQAALVEFVEDHRADPLQKRIAAQLAGQAAFGHHPQPGITGTDALEAHSITDFAAEGGAALVADPTGEGARCDPARLEQVHPARNGREQGGRDARAFARTGRGDHHGPAVGGQSG